MRVGKFTADIERLKGNDPVVPALYRQGIIILRALPKNPQIVDDLSYGEIECIGIWQQFDDVMPGAEIPEYMIGVKNLGDGELEFTARRVKESGPLYTINIAVDEEHSDKAVNAVCIPRDGTPMTAGFGKNIPDALRDLAYDWEKVR